MTPFYGVLWIVILLVLVLAKYIGAAVYWCFNKLTAKSYSKMSRSKSRRDYWKMTKGKPNQRQRTISTPLILKTPIDPTVPGKHAVPKTIEKYEMYNKIENGRFIWICNFGDPKNEIAKNLLDGEDKIEDLFIGQEPHTIKFKKYERNREYKIKHARNTCQWMLKKELNVYTDCFICIISSYSNDTHIFNDDSEESIASFLSLDNHSTNKRLQNNPKILIFDLHDTKSKREEFLWSQWKVNSHREKHLSLLAPGSTHGDCDILLMLR
ncbi:uncharacterized protein LOC128235402 [Mya arenaria]|uniref:uncharacterized protein LOC128235402 n=1 Tax=Mya arenaria TaxID=6604 RepID=UPI0022E5D56D|nr:uncharacterized protein LOC128235402 [Mya arenaria]